jgi:hypothetical protein
MRGSAALSTAAPAGQHHVDLRAQHLEHLLVFGDVELGQALRAA